MTHVSHLVRARATPSGNLFGATIVVPVARESAVLRERFPHGYDSVERRVLTGINMSREALLSHVRGGAYVEDEAGNPVESAS